jgi:hypothetical protein
VYLDLIICNSDNFFFKLFILDEQKERLLLSARPYEISNRNRNQEGLQKNGNQMASGQESKQ